jgi:hypothetical protein
MRTHALVLMLALGVALARGQAAARAEDPVLAKVRSYALSYGNSLPDYVCTVVADQTLPLDAADVSRPTTRTSSIEADLYASARQEDKLLKFERRVDGKVQTRRPLGRIFGRGEFAFVLERVFGPDTGTTFEPERFTKLRGKQVVEIPFEVGSTHGATIHELRPEFRVPYKGSVIADPDTGAVFRIEAHVSGFPADSVYLGIDLAFDFKNAKVGAHEYLLPSGLEKRPHWRGPGSRYADGIAREEYSNYGAPPAKPKFIEWAEGPYQPAITFSAP